MTESIHCLMRNIDISMNKTCYWRFIVYVHRTTRTTNLKGVPMQWRHDSLFVCFFLFSTCSFLINPHFPQMFLRQNNKTMKIHTVKIKRRLTDNFSFLINSKGPIKFPNLVYSSLVIVRSDVRLLVYCCSSSPFVVLSKRPFCILV